MKHKNRTKLKPTRKQLFNKYKEFHGPSPLQRSITSILITLDELYPVSKPLTSSTNP